MRPSVDAIPTRDIVDFALDPEQNLAADGSLIIDPLRARSLAANSFASSDDAALLVARAEGKSVGYIAVHWDRLHFRGADHRFAWGHQFFVVPEYRHLLCAMLLLRKSLSLADGWGAWGIAPDAAKICRALGCFEPVSIERARSSGWVDTAARLRSAVPLQGIARLPLRLSSRALEAWSQRKLDAAGVSLAEDDGSDDFVERAVSSIDPDAVYFARSAAKLRWYVEFPWIRQLRGGAAPEDRAHAFTRARHRHQIELLRLSSTAPPSLGYLLLCHTQHSATSLARTALLDWGFSANDDDGFAIAVAAAVARRKDAGTDYVDVFTADRVRARAEKVPGLHTSPPHPTFLAYANKKSGLRDLRNVAPASWRMGSVEGDQIPIVW